MLPKYLLSISVWGWLCLCFITPSFANLSQEQTLANLPRQVLPVSEADAIEFEIAEATPEMQYYLQLYTGKWQHYTEQLLGKATYYFPIFSFHLREAQLPDALKYLPLIESHLVPDVRSSQGALGLWQFMPETAQFYGLKVNGQTDQRLDAHLASAAAAKMLGELYRDFEDWDLVLAAYNCGPWRVRRAMQKTNSQNYEKIAPYLPRQTQNYLKKFKAMVHVGLHYQQYGLAPNLLSISPDKKWQQMPLPSGQDLKKIARLAQIDLSLLLQLNPNQDSESFLLPDYAADRLDTIYHKVNGKSLRFLAKADSGTLAPMLICSDMEVFPSIAFCEDLLPQDKGALAQLRYQVLSWALLPRLRLLA